MANKIDYMAIFKELLDVFEGRKPKPKDFYNKVYLITGILSQVQDLQEFQLFLKENTRLEYESEKRKVKRTIYDEEKDEYKTIIREVDYFKNAVLRFEDGYSAIPRIKEVLRRGFPQEWENGMPK